MKPFNCPFCGGADIKLQIDRLFNTPHCRYYCNQCGTRHDFSVNKNEDEARKMALDVWNRRVIYEKY